MKTGKTRRILSMLLTAVMLVAAFPMAAVETNAALTEGCFTYGFTGDCVMITGFDSTYEGDVVIPNNIDGYAVVRINSKVFYDCDGITSVTIPSMVEDIGEQAFGSCDSLTNITVSEKNLNYYSIDGVLFRENKNVLVQYPGGRTDTAYSIPEGIKWIGEYAFYGCKNLESVTIPDSVYRMETGAFYGCTSLKNIVVSDNVTEMGSHIFYGCTSLTSATISNNVSYMGGSTFYGCSNLTSVTIGNKATYIGRYAFRGCTSLSDVTIPDSVTHIEEGAFYGCTGLANVTIPGKYIGASAFRGCTGLTGVTIGDGVKSIGESAFRGCTNLKRVTIGDSMTKIGPDAFRGCTNLASVTIPDSVTSIEDRAFVACTSLKRLAIPDSVTSMGDSVFLSCTKLTISCHANSYAHTYAVKNSIPVTLLCYHTSTEIVGAVSPTCNDGGYTGDEVCSDCGELIEEGVTTSAAGHSLVQHSAKSATCTDIGWFAYDTCKNCDYTTYVEIRPQGHYFEGNACIHCGKAKPVLRGDVNGNGVVDVSDLTVFRRYIGGATIAGFNEAAADVDGDGEVKSTDVTVLARIIAGAVL